MRIVIALALAAGCTAPAVGGELPPPVVPGDNPTTAESVELGRHLFYDTRLSVNESIACADCHKQEFAFADDVAISPGATGELGVLNAPSLTNVAYAAPLTWAHARIETIEEQLRLPMFGEAPIEMGMLGNEDAIAARLQSEPVYRDLFAAAYGASALDGPAVLDDARYALASFVRSLVSNDAPFDQFLAGDASAISESAKRGSELFFSARLGCGNCHAGFNFSEATRSTATTGQRTSPFHNIGLYNVDGEGGYPEDAPGLIAESGIARDNGRFRVPSLRNVAITSPYMHDGSVDTLEDVIRIYEDGGRVIEVGPNAGDGRASPLRSEDLADFELTDAERADLIEFLRSLTDRTFIENPALSSPW